MAAAALILTVGSAIIGGISAHNQGVAAKQQADYSAQVARNNDLLAKQYAETERQKGAVAEQNKREETAQRVSIVRAVGAANGLDVNSGTPLDLQADTARMGELDALTIRNNAARNAYGYEVQGINFRNAATLDESRGRYATQAGNLGALSSIIGAASSVSGKWDGMKNSGAFG